MICIPYRFISFTMQFPLCCRVYLFMITHTSLAQYCSQLFFLVSITFKLDSFKFKQEWCTVPIRQMSCTEMQFFPNVIFCVAWIHTRRFAQCHFYFVHVSFHIENFPHLSLFFFMFSSMGSLKFHLKQSPIFVSFYECGVCFIGYK